MAGSDGQEKHVLPAATEAAFRSLIRTYGLVRRFNDPFFAQHGISASQWAVLRVLQRAEAAHAAHAAHEVSSANRQLPNVKCQGAKAKGLMPEGNSSLGTRHSTLGTASAGGSLRLTDLGERLLVRPPSITGVVDRLQRLGLVARTASTTDLRAKYVSLTEAGRELLGRMRQCHGERIKAILSVLGEKDQNQLRRLLDKVGENLETLSDMGTVGRSF